MAKVKHVSLHPSGCRVFLAAPTDIAGFQVGQCLVLRGPGGVPRFDGRALMVHTVDRNEGAVTLLCELPGGEAGDDLLFPDGSDPARAPR